MIVTVGSAQISLAMPTFLFANIDAMVSVCHKQALAFFMPGRWTMLMVMPSFGYIPFLAFG